MIRLGEHVMWRLHTKHAPERRSRMGALRDDMTTILIDDIVPLAQRIEAQGVTSFAVAATHQQLGDLLRKLGHGDLRGSSTSRVTTCSPRS